MKTNIDYKLDELLVNWHRHRSGYQHTRGFSSQDGTCKDFRAPCHFDWSNGAADARADALEVAAVDEAMDKIPNQPHRWRTALEFEARNLSSGAAVWTSPVLPRDLGEREVLVMEARNKLMNELRKDGVLG